MDLKESGEGYWEDFKGEKGREKKTEASMERFCIS